MVSLEEAWTRGGLRISRRAMDLVDGDALRGYAADEEACGYMTGPADDALFVDEAIAMQNTANRLHALDPETYFRTARMFFAFNEKKFDDAFRASRAAEAPIKVLYHSHLDAGAYFSPTDKAVMSCGEPPSVEGGAMKLGPGPAWPLAFLVVSVTKRGVAERRLHIWDDAKKDFVESSFTIVD